ncbi:MAG: hydroxyacid dehydrogenase [Gammaproteobacteria bacterium]|nr:hydroxyacid dehydrogenase [Gammaproteobacteria bacterium]
MSVVEHAQVLLLRSMYHSDGEELLTRHVEVHRLHAPTQEAIHDAIRAASAVVVRYPCRLSAAAIRAGTNLVVISTSGRGTDAVDIDAASAQGVIVVNNPGFGTVPVSEHTIGLMLDLSKQITRSHNAARQDKGWGEGHKSTRFHLEGRTLGVIGCGQIGTEVARKCVTAFNMEVLVYDPYVSPSKAQAVGTTWVQDLMQLLREAQFVSLHPELNEETRGMIGEAEFQQMRRDAFLINTARGKIVQQPALVRALTEGWIAGAALDVFDPEPPPPDSPLYALDNLIVTPHVAGLSIEARRELALSAATQVLQVLRGERPPNMVNPDVWDKLEQRPPD